MSAEIKLQSSRSRKRVATLSRVRLQKIANNFVNLILCTSTSSTSYNDEIYAAIHLRKLRDESGQRNHRITAY